MTTLMIAESPPCNSPCAFSGASCAGQAVITGCTKPSGPCTNISISTIGMFHASP